MGMGFFYGGGERIPLDEYSILLISQRLYSIFFIFQAKNDSICLQLFPLLFSVFALDACPPLAEVQFGHKLMYTHIV